MKGYGVGVPGGDIVKALKRLIKLNHQDGSLKHLARVRMVAKPSRRKKAKQRLAWVKRQKHEAAKRKREKYCDFD